MDLQKRKMELLEQLRQTAVQLEQIRGAISIIDELILEQPEVSVNGESPG